MGKDRCGWGEWQENDEWESGGLEQVGSRAHAALLVHMQRFTYSATGALRWKRDLQEYAEAVQAAACPAVDAKMEVSAPRTGPTPSPPHWQSPPWDLHSGPGCREQSRRGHIREGIGLAFGTQVACWLSFTQK